MGERVLDKICIRDLRVSCIIGINDEERVNKQEVLINICMECDLRAACASDNIADTIDYKKVKKDILALVEDSSFFLVEKMAEEIAALCLSDQRVLRISVGVDKPGALRFARSVGVEIVRGRGV